MDHILLVKYVIAKKKLIFIAENGNTEIKVQVPKVNE